MKTSDNIKAQTDWLLKQCFVLGWLIFIVGCTYLMAQPNSYLIALVIVGFILAMIGTLELVTDQVSKLLVSAIRKE